MFVRVRSAHHWRAHDGRGRWGKTDEIPPREEWLIAEWPKGKPEPTDYWISNLPVSTKPGRLARLARLRWKIELDYRQLKGQLGLDHYEGRSWLGWYHHTAGVSEELCKRDRKDFSCLQPRNAGSIKRKMLNLSVRSEATSSPESGEGCCPGCRARWMRRSLWSATRF